MCKNVLLRGRGASGGELIERNVSIGGSHHLLLAMC